MTNGVASNGLFEEALDVGHDAGDVGLAGLGADPLGEANNDRHERLGVGGGRVGFERLPHPGGQVGLGEELPAGVFCGKKLSAASLSQATQSNPDTPKPAGRSTSWLAANASISASSSPSASACASLASR